MDFADELLEQHSDTWTDPGFCTRFGLSRARTEEMSTPDYLWPRRMTAQLNSVKLCRHGFWLFSDLDMQRQRLTAGRCIPTTANSFCISCMLRDGHCGRRLFSLLETDGKLADTRMPRLR